MLQADFTGAVMRVRTLVLWGVLVVWAGVAEGQVLRDRPPVWRLALGGGAGEVAALGMTVGLAAGCTRGSEECGWGALTAGVVASAFTVPAGVKLAGSRRSYGRLLLGSFAGFAVGAILADAVHTTGVDGGELYLIVPVTQIVGTVVAGL